MNHIRIVLSILIYFVFLSDFTYSQIYENVTGNSVGFNSGEKYTSIEGGSVFNEFYSKNKVRIENINLKISELPIDRCHYGTIVIHVCVDTIGQTTCRKILQGTNYQKIDSIIYDLIDKYPGNWNPAIASGIPINIRVNLTFQLMNDYSYTEKNREENRTMYSYSVNSSITNVVNPHKACDDCDYYYNNGIQNYKKEEYKEAIYNFKRAIIYNAYYIDAHYNLAQSYFMINKPEKACECLKKIVSYGDTSVSEEIRTKCKDVK